MRSIIAWIGLNWGLVGDATAEPAGSPKSQSMAARHERRGLIYCLMVVVGMLVLLTLSVLPATRDHYHAIESGVQNIMVGWLPSSLERLAHKGAGVFLTPWLYGVMLLVWFAERYFPARPQQRFWSVGLIQDLVSWLILNSLLRIILLGAYVGLLQTLYDNHLSFLTILKPSMWNPVFAVISGLVIADFLNWFHHVVRHKVPLFWAFHAVHHSQRDMNMFTDLRVHVVEYIVAKPIVLLPLFALGLQDKTVLWVLVILEAFSRVYHANIRSNFGWLRYVFVTPQSHRVHHSADPRHQDCNFAVIFSVWDRLFGTQWHDHTEYPDTGIYDRAFPYEQSVGGLSIVTNYLRQFSYPFVLIHHALGGNGWKLQSTHSTLPERVSD